MRLGILGSTRGTGMLALIQAIASNKLRASIEIVVSNKLDAGILNRARAHQLHHQLVDAAKFSSDQYHHKLSAIFRKHQVDLIVLIGYMRILSSAFVEDWENKIINIHPSLLPAFGGKIDLAVHRAVLAAGVKETGCTVHYVNALLDQGPIIIQKTCPVLPDDTEHTLKERVQQLEAMALVEVVTRLA